MTTRGTPISHMMIAASKLSLFGWEQNNSTAKLVPDPSAGEAERSIGAAPSIRSALATDRSSRSMLCHRITPEPNELLLILTFPIAERKIARPS